MLPAWVSKLKDLKAMKSKQKQSKTPFHSPSFTLNVRKSPDMCFAKALSAQRANNNANCECLDGSSGRSTDTDSILSSSDNDAHICMQRLTHISAGTCSHLPSHICMGAASTDTSVDTSTCLFTSKHTFADTCSSSSTQICMNSTTTNMCTCFASTNTSKGSSTHICMHTSTDAQAATRKLCSYGSAEFFNSAEASMHAIDCKDFECEGKVRMVLSAQNDLHGANDNDTEGSNVLTPNTIESSFGSESSSADSSMVHKCGYAEDNRQCLMQWQEGEESSALGRIESSMEASVYPEEATQFSEWKGKSSSEDLRGMCSFDMEAMSRLSFCEGAVYSSKFQQTPLENFKGVSSLDMEDMSRLTYNEGHLNSQERSSQNVAESHCLSSFYECHTSAFRASRIAPGSAFSMWYEGSPSFANHSFGPLHMQKEERAPRNVSYVSSNLQQQSNVTAKNCSAEGCKVSFVKDLKVIPSLWKERSMFEGTMLCCLSYSEWEERSALIAVENPGLMLSSKWHASSCTMQNPSLKSSPRANQDAVLSTCIGQDNRSGKSMCGWQDNSNGMSKCVKQDSSDGLSVCPRQDNGNAGYHKSTHDAYLRRGRRHRGSSFSAALPKDLQGVVGDSIALVKMSHSPYEDFRHSMYEMIMEKDLEESMDVEELLYCYLSLNAPEHHELIKEVFSDVWSSILMSMR